MRPMDFTRDDTSDAPPVPAPAAPATQLSYAVATWLQRVDAAAHPKAKLNVAADADPKQTQYRLIYVMAPTSGGRHVALCLYKARLRGPAANAVRPGKVVVGQFVGRRRQWPRLSAEGRRVARSQSGVARRRQGLAAGLAGRGGAGRAPPRRRPDRLHAADRPAVVYRQSVLRRVAAEPGWRRHPAGRPAGAGGAGAFADGQRQGARLATAAGARLATFDAAAAALAAALARRRGAAPHPDAGRGHAGRRQHAALA